MFLKSALDYLFRRLPDQIKIVGGVILDVSPFGEKKTLLSKLVTTIKIFGPIFALRYGLVDLWNKILQSDVESIFDKNQIQKININRSINSIDSLTKISKLNPDLIISITGNQIYKKALLDIPKKGIINLHSALLPKYRGLMPTFWALKNNEKETGVSVFFVDEGIDSGPILVQKKIKLGKISQWELIRFTKYLGIEAIIEAISLIDSGDYKTKPNNEEESSYYSFPTRKDVMEFKKNGNKLF